MNKLVLLGGALLGVVAFFWLIAIANSTSVLAASPDCTACHSQMQTVTLSGGDKVSGQVDAAKYAASAHGQLPCELCHKDITGYPHPKPAATNVRSFIVELNDSCAGCHGDVAKELASTSHAVAWGNTIVCSDCHNPHTTNADQVAIAPKYAACDSCHPIVANSYLDSVHGQAVSKDLEGLPYCTSCHAAHQFNVKPTRAASIDICTNCHSNAALMGRYDVSTNVVSTYFRDFHGKTALLQGKQHTDVTAAVCTDCHGVHSIQAATDTNPLSTRDGTEVTCQQCHPNTKAYFASAWLSHVTPSPTKAPLVFLADWFYRLMIPFVMVGLAIHIGFDIRQLAKRKKGAVHGND